MSSTDDMGSRFKGYEEVQQSLEELMGLLEETASHVNGEETKAAKDELDILREAATLIAFRLIFLTEVARRGLLYNDSSATEERRLSLLQLVSGEPEREGDLFFALQHLTQVIRGDQVDPKVAVSGATIFANLPNEAFEKGIQVWLEGLDNITHNANPDLLRRWDGALAKTAAIVTGEFDDYVHLSTAAATGFGGAEHAQRVLGDVYEQILAMIPKRKKNGSITLTASGKTKESEKDQRKALGAHYTPERLVDEVVRAALGPLFEYHWKEAKKDSDAYIERVKNLKILDPAMGSAHFLTTAALELAREIAFVELKQVPRPFEIHEPTAYEDSHAASIEALGDATMEKTYTDKIRGLIPGLVQQACFGVDVNPLAAELGKLSLWLFALAVDRDEQNTRPELTFLDGNILVGDSLVGVTWKEAVDIIEERFGHRADETNEWANFSLFETRLRTLSMNISDLHRMIRMPAEKLGIELKKSSDFKEHAVNFDPAYTLGIRSTLLERAREFQEELRWFYDLAVLADFYKVTTWGNSGANKLRKALNKFGAQLPEDTKSPEAEIWSALIHAKGGRGSELEELKTAIKNAAAHLPGADKTHRAFHWELAFPQIFPRRDDADTGFDAIMANPPFIGNKRLRSSLGKLMVDYLTTRYTNGSAPDYAGFFFLRYNSLTNSRAAVGSLASNSIAQASNRALVTHKIMVEDASFSLKRALPNRPWPGEAIVHFCMIHFVRPNLKAGPPLLLIPKDGDIDSDVWTTREVGVVSSYLDEYPDFSLKSLPSHDRQLVHQGMVLRGNFSLHRDKGETLEDALSKVPNNEHLALASYFSGSDVTQNKVPTPSDIVIDFAEPLRKFGLEEASPTEQKAFLSDKFNYLFPQLTHVDPRFPDEPSVKESRQSLEDSKDNEKDRIYWWSFARPRYDLRNTWDDVNTVLALGRTVKVWAPPTLSKPDSKYNLSLAPMMEIYLTTVSSNVWFGVCCSFLFEMIVRRQCSSLKSDLRFSPTRVFPFFPVPWKPKFEQDSCKLTVFPIDEQNPKLAPIATAVTALLEQRTVLLEKPDTNNLNITDKWGPTELYNSYDNKTVTIEAIEILRQYHVDLFQAVLCAFEWDDLADVSSRDAWGFERPWVDRTPRFVPPETVRRDVYRRMGELNEERYRYELGLFLERALSVMEPVQKLSRNKIAEAMEAKYCPNADGDGKSLDHDVLEAALEMGVEEGQLKAISKGNYFEYALRTDQAVRKVKKVVKEV